MVYKEKRWSKYGRKEGIIEIITRDESGAKTGNFKATNQKDYSRVLKIIRDKCGYKPEMKEIREKEEDELNWFNKNVEW